MFRNRARCVFRDDPCWLARELLLSDVGVGRRQTFAVVVTIVLGVGVECYLLVDGFTSCVPAPRELVVARLRAVVVSVILKPYVREGCIDRLLFSECVIVNIFSL